MKTIGLIGGTGWVSTAEYYRLINEGINKKLGGQEFAKIILHSLNYGEVMRLQKKGKPEMLAMLTEVANKLIAAGAEGIVLCANTLHMFYQPVADSVDVPLIHIAEATAGKIKEAGFSTIGLLGTKLTMEETFYSDVLDANGIKTLVPEKQDREFINEKITTELFHSVFHEKTRQQFLRIMNDLELKGAQGIVLGCTEIPLLIKREHTTLFLFDTLEIHSEAIVDFMLSD